MQIEDCQEALGAQWEVVRREIPRFRLAPRLLSRPTDGGL